MISNSTCAILHNSWSQVENLLRDQVPMVNLFKFIINPHDFGQSVENMFYLSFLIRDGKCALELDENTREPMICESSNFRFSTSWFYVISSLRASFWRRLSREWLEEASARDGAWHGNLEGWSLPFSHTLRSTFSFLPSVPLKSSTSKSL